MDFNFIMILFYLAFDTTKIFNSLKFQFHYDLILLTINVYLQRQGKAISISL